MISPGSTSRTYLRADDVERAGLRGEDRAAVEFAEHQRADAERIAGADQLLVGQRHQRIGALDRAQRLDEAVDEAVALGLRDQMQDDLGIGGGLHHGAVAHQFATQGQPVGEIAVMADRKAAGVEFGEQRLHIAQDGGAGGGVADMADGGIAGKPLDHLAAGEGVADQAKPPLGMKPGAVEGDDAGGLLAAVLQGVQPERRDGGGFLDGRRCRTRRTPRVACPLRGRPAIGSRPGRGSDRVGRHRRGFASRPLRLFLGCRQRAAGFSISFLRLSRAGLV